MSIQEKTYTSKKTGKTTTKYYANVWDPEQKKSLTGPLQLKRKEAVKDEDGLIRALEQGKIIHNKNKGITIDKAADTFFASVETHYAHSTWKVYQYYYRHYIEPIFGDKKVCSIDPIHIQKFVNMLSQKYSPETVNKNISVLSVLFQFCAETLKACAHNPAAGIKRCKIASTKKSTWADKQICAFFGSDAKASHYYPMFCVSLFLGMRPGEVCGLAESDLDKVTKTLTLNRGLDKYGVLTDLKTPESHRAILLPDMLYKQIYKALMWKKKEQLKNPEFAKNDFLFVSILGNPILPDTYSHAFKRMQESYNKVSDQPLPDITLYGCRHSFATNNLLSGNVSAKLVSDIMGNSVKTVLTNYAHVAPDMQKSVLDNYADKISKGRS